MSTKLQIARFLIVFGFLLSIVNYSVGLFDFYTSDDKISIVLEETEKSGQKEKDNSEKEEFKEKDKISQYADDEHVAVATIDVRLYPDFYSHNTSVYLEHKTPPPEYS